MSADLRFYLSLLLRRLPLMAAVFLTCAVGGVLLALRLPPVYAAETTLLIERAQIPDELAATTVRIDPADQIDIDQIDILEQHLMTRDTLAGLARDHAVFDAAEGMSEADLADAMREKADISRTGSGGRVVQTTVAFTAGDPVTAATVANALADLLVAENQRLRAGRASETELFFSEEAARLAAALETQRAAVLTFRERHADTLPERLDYHLARQSQLQTRIDETAAAQLALADERLRVTHVYKATGQLGIEDPQALTPEQRQLIDLQKDLDALAVSAPETDPRRMVLQTRIAQLESVVKGQIGAEGDTADLSPLDIELARLDAQGAALVQEIASAETELAEVTGMIEATPARALSLETLERDQATLQAQYDEAVAGLAKARTGERIEQLAKGQRIAILDRALPPDGPVRPNRRAIAGGGVVLGLALGIGAFILLELLNTAIRRPKELTTGLGIAPFAVLPYLETRRDRLRRRALGWGVAGATAAVAAALVWGFHGGHLSFEAVAGQIDAALPRRAGG